MNAPNIADLFYKHFEDNDRKYDSSGEVTFAPSYLNACKRQVFYKKTGEGASNPADLPSRFKMFLGSIDHEGLQNIIKSKGIMIECEKHHTYESNGIKMNYFIDGIIEVDGVRYILEIKTTYSRGIDFVKTQPKDDHIMQTLCYMQFQGIKDAIIVYIGRDNGYIFQHNLSIGDSLTVSGTDRMDMLEKWNASMDALPQLKKDIENGKLPERDYKIAIKVIDGVIVDSFTKDKVKYKTDWQCSYCSFKDKCWSNELAEIKNHKFYIDGQFMD